MGDQAERAQIQRAKHEPHEFGLLYDQYIDRIYAYAVRRTGDLELAKDVTSATFEKALRGLQRYRWRGRSFGAWLYRIARNVIVAHYRKQRKFAPMPTQPRSVMDLEGSILKREQMDGLLTAFGRVSSRDRELLSLRFFEGLSSAEVAEVLGCSTQNVYLRLHRALKRLRTELDLLEARSESDVQEEDR